MLRSRGAPAFSPAGVSATKHLGVRVQNRGPSSRLARRKQRALATLLRMTQQELCCFQRELPGERAQAVALLGAGGARPCQDVVIQVLDAPERDLEGQGARHLHGGIEASSEFAVGGILAQ